MNERFMKDFNGDKIFSLEYDKETLKDMVLEKQEEIARLQNIIKEAREYIDKTQMPEGYKWVLLEIFDKGE